MGSCLRWGLSGAAYSSLLVLGACTLDSAPIKPGRSPGFVALDGGGAGTSAAGMGAAGSGGAGGTSASPTGDTGVALPDTGVMDARTSDTGTREAGMDAKMQRDAKPDLDAMPDDTKDGGVDAETDSGPDVMEDSGTDAGADSGTDAGNDSGVDAGTDAGPDCGEPQPCYCPHEEPPDGDCEAAACAFADCAPDTMCEYVSSDTGKYYICDNQRVWQAARQRCTSQTDMLLASVESEEEDDYLFSLIEDKTWVGGNDIAEEGTWLWSDGTQFYDDAMFGGGPVDDAYTNWDTGEPNNLGLSLGAGNCMILWPQNLGWADAECTDQHGFICEVVQ